MEIRDERQVLAGAPVRLCWQGEIEAAGRRGAVLFYHGLGASIAGQTNELHSLAAHGFLAVGVDNVGHGERRWPDLDRQMCERGGPVDPFVLAIMDTAHEVPRIVDELLRRGWSREGRIGLGGISMGGFIAYRAAVVEPRLTALTPILGSPAWDAPLPESPHHHLERFHPLALLSQNAGRDRNVPPEDARRLHEQLTPLYAATPERLAYVEFPDAEHFMPEDQWHRLWANVIAWYRRFLSDDQG